MRHCYLILLLLLTGLAPARAQRPWPATRLPRPASPLLVQPLLRVLVLDHRGTPLPGITVQLLNGSSVSRRQQTDRVGVVRFFSVLRGHYTLVISPDGERVFRGYYGDQLVLPADSLPQTEIITLNEPVAAPQPAYDRQDHRRQPASPEPFFRVDPLGSYLPGWAWQLKDEELATATRQAPGSAAGVFAQLPALQPQVLSPISGDVALRAEGLDPHLLESQMLMQRGWSGQLGRWQAPALSLGRASYYHGQGLTVIRTSPLWRGPTSSLGPELTTLASLNSVGETTAQAYGYQGTSTRSLGLLAAGSWRPAAGRQADGLVVSPQLGQLLLRPTLRLRRTNGRLTGQLSYELNRQHRAGGYVAGPAPYVVRSRQGRHTGIYNLSADLSYLTSRWWMPHEIELDGLVSTFRRQDTEPDFRFAGRQLMLGQTAQAWWRVGRNGSYISLNGGLHAEQFRPLAPSAEPLAYAYRRQSHNLVYYWGGSRYARQAELRAVAEMRFEQHNVFGVFWLPRATVAWQPRRQGRFGPWQLAIGRDYHAPHPFDLFVPDNAQTSPHLFYRRAVPAATRAERLWRAVVGSRYRFSWPWLNDATLAQEVSYATIRQPLVQRAAVLDGQYGTYLLNADYQLRSYASHTYLDVRRGPARLLAYYGFSYVRRRGQDYLPFSPRHRASVEISRQLRQPWRLQASARLVAGQAGYDNEALPAYGLLGASAEYRPGKKPRTTLTLTADNLLNVRQRRYTLVPTGRPDAPPAFQPLWGPQLGRVLTLSVQVSMPKKN